MTVRVPVVDIAPLKADSASPAYRSTARECVPAEELLEANSPRYRPVHWSRICRRRAGGDFADHGAEIQISDFRTEPSAS